MMTQDEQASCLYYTVLETTRFRLKYIIKWDLKEYGMRIRNGYYVSALIESIVLGNKIIVLRAS
jgi:hypothetical protein